MRVLSLAIFVAVAVLHVPAQAGLIVFSGRVDFDAAAPGLPVEDFEEATIGAGSVGILPAPLDAWSSNAYFSPGDILAGVQFSASAVHGGDDLALVGAGYLGNPSKLIVANYFADSFNVVLAPGVTAIGFDVHSFMGGGTVRIDVYDSSDGLLGTYDASGSEAGVF